MVEEEKVPEKDEHMTEKQARAIAAEQVNRVFKFEDNDGSNIEHKAIMDPEMANIVLVK